MDVYCRAAIGIITLHLCTTVMSSCIVEVPTCNRCEVTWLACQFTHATMLISYVQDDCVAALRNGTVDAFLQHYILNAYYLTIQPCDLTLVDIGFMVGRTGRWLDNAASE
jgi:hypothetical protein